MPRKEGFLPSSGEETKPLAKVDLGGSHQEEGVSKKMEKSKEEMQKESFFNKDFAFQSQRFIQPEKNNLQSWDSYWHLTSQNTVIFKNLDKLIPEKTKDRVKYAELKAFFHEYPLETKQYEPAWDEEFFEGYAHAIRELLYLYDKYYEPKLLEDIKGLDKKSLPPTVPDYFQDFYVKAFPFLNERDQSNVYGAFITDKKEVAAKVIPKRDLLTNNVAMEYRRNVLSFNKKKIIDKLVNLPLDTLSDLHVLEINQLLDLVRFIIKDKDISFHQKRKENPKYRDPQYPIYKNIEEALVKEVEKREKEDRDSKIEAFIRQGARVIARYDALENKKKEYSDLDLKEFKALSRYIDNIRKDRGNPVYAFLVKPETEYKKVLQNIKEENLDRVSHEFSTFDRKIIEANKAVGKYENKLRAEELRDDIQAHLAGADLATSREFWLAMGEDPKEISRQFAGGTMENIPVRSRKIFMKAVEKKLAEKDSASLKHLDLTLLFKAKYKELTADGVLNSEKRKELEALAKEFEMAKKSKDKKQILKKIDKLSLDNLELSFSKFRNDLLKNTEGEQHNKVKEIAKKFKAIDSYEEKLAIYNELVDLTEDWGFDFISD